MMVTTSPSRPADRRREDAPDATTVDEAVGGALSATVCTPPYLLGAGILMLGSNVLLIPGIFLLALGATLQAGATGAVRAIKMSATLITAPRSKPEAAGRPEQGSS